MDHVEEARRLLAASHTRNMSRENWQPRKFTRP